MKERVEGRRYSKQRIRTAETSAELDELVQAHGGALGDTWQSLRARLLKGAWRILSDAGLPCSLWVAYTANGAFRALPAPSDPDLGETIARIDAYVESQGYARDSAARLAARIAATIDNIDRELGDARLFAYELGRFTTLLNVYTVEDAGRRVGGRATGGAQTSQAELGYAEVRKRYREALEPHVTQAEVCRRIDVNRKRVQRAFAAVNEPVPRWDSS